MPDSAAPKPLQTPEQRKLRRMVKEHHDQERQIRTQVARLRRAGDSWATIGEVLGVTQQAAHKRFAGEGGASPSTAPR